MATLTAIKQFAFFIVCMVESEFDWACNYSGDGTISIGIHQCYGQHGRNLLSKIIAGAPDQGGILQSQAPTLYSDVVDESKNTWSWWTGRPLSSDEIAVVKNILVVDSVKAIQEQDCYDKFDQYISKGRSYGIPIEDNFQQSVYFLQMYHNNPAMAGRIVSASTPTGSLQMFHNSALNDYKHGSKKYMRNRLNWCYGGRTVRGVAYPGINGWDGISIPTFPGWSTPGDFDIDDDVQAGDYVAETTVSDPSGSPSPIKYMIQSGDCYIIYGTDDANMENGVVMYPASAQRWIPGFNVLNAPIIPDFTDQGEPTPPPVPPGTDQQRLVDSMLSLTGTLKYSQESDLRNNITGGWGDCSGVVRWVYKTIVGLDVGTWTGAIWKTGTNIYAGSISGIPWSSLVLGDLIVYSKSGGSSGHVEMYIGTYNGQANQISGHGGGTGPKIKNGPTYNSGGRYQICRVNRYI